MPNPPYKHAHHHEHPHNTGVEHPKRDDCRRMRLGLQERELPEVVAVGELLDLLPLLLDLERAEH